MTAAKDKKSPPPEPVNLVDGVPDRTTHSAAWKYIVLAAVFVLWVAFLLYCLRIVLMQ